MPNSRHRLSPEKNKAFSLPIKTAFYLASFIPYFFLKRSTRPAVSISFCLPVKNGWHSEHMPMLISGFVERVLMTFPHAHVILDATYFGCIFSFITFLQSIISENVQHQLIPKKRQIIMHEQSRKASLFSFTCSSSKEIRHCFLSSSGGQAAIPLIPPD